MYAFLVAIPTYAAQTLETSEEVMTRARRAHYRLSWKERLARVITSSLVSRVCAAVSRGPQERVTVSLRITCSHCRRSRQRGQSLHSTGERGGGSGGSDG